MAQSRSNSLYLLLVLAAVLAFGATHRAQACPDATSGADRPSCCDGMDQPAMDPPGIQHSLDAGFDCATARGLLENCLSQGHCLCGQSAHVAQVTAREVRPASLAPSAMLVWLGPPITVGLTPPPQGPPDTGPADPPARHTYLATLRLRI